jgi:AbiV family abortive infection protein
VSQTKINNLKFDTALDGAIKCLRNAQELCDESELLHKNEMYARSYALSHFAREELGKSFMLFRALIEVSAGIKIDWKKLNRRFRDHKQKLLNDAAISIFLFGAEFKKQNFPIEMLFHMADGQNDKKNTCLYADWDNGSFTLPSDVITQKQSERNLDLAIFRVARLSPYLLDLQSLKEETKEKVRASYPDELVQNPAEFIDKMLSKVS